jgi:DNA-binding NtrC family response regulator
MLAWVSGTPLRLLHIEDNADDALLVELALTRGGYLPSIVRVFTAVAMSDALDREPWDLVLSDYNMPAFDAPAALALLQAHDLDIPFIIVSGTVSEHAAVTSMKAGAHDYLSKQNLRRLAPAIARELQEARRRAEHRRATQELHASKAHLAAIIETLVGRIDADVAAIDDALAELQVGLEAATPEARAAAGRLAGIVAELKAFARAVEPGRA